MYVILIFTYVRIVRMYSETLSLIPIDIWQGKTDGQTLTDMSPGEIL